MLAPLRGDTLSYNIEITYVTKNVKEYLDANAIVLLDTIKYLF